MLGRLPNLRLLITTGPFNAAIDMAAASEAGIVVCGTGGTASPTAELTWGLILALVRHVPAEDAAIRAGGWQQTVGVGLRAGHSGWSVWGGWAPAWPPSGTPSGCGCWPGARTSRRTAAEHHAELVDKAELSSWPTWSRCTWFSATAHAG